MNQYKNVSGINIPDTFFFGIRFFIRITILVLVLVTWIPLAFGLVCQPPGLGQHVTVKHIYDGDTLLLKDGRRVRLIGVNAPELGRDSKPDEPFAQQARQAVVEFLNKPGRITIYPDKEIRDKYDRHLVYLYKQTITESFNESVGDAVSLERELLARGLAFHIAVPPNLYLAECFSEAETEARRHRRGIWGPSGIKPISADSVKNGGYQRVFGAVERVAISKKAWWIDLGGVTAVIYPEHQHGFNKSAVEAWPGRRLEIEGWVYQSSYKGKLQWRIKLETPYSLSKIDGNYPALED
jgi:endonuclease YncB( thermonuclease family)